MTDYIPEVDSLGLDDALRAGDRIIDHSTLAPGSGTIGTFMKSGDELYALTAGHVVNDAAGTTFNIEHRLTKNKIQARHLRLRYPDYENKMAREVGILRVNEEDKHKVEPCLSRVNIHRYSENGQRKCFDMVHDRIRAFAITSLVTKRSGIRLYKEGCTTGMTFGPLTQTFIVMAEAWESLMGLKMKDTPDEKLKIDNLGVSLKQLWSYDSYKWAGVVSWLAERDPFAGSGDS